MADIRDASGKLLAIECDRCPARLVPGPHVVDSGWIKMGQRIGSEAFEWYYCPRCQHRLRQ